MIRKWLAIGIILLFVGIAVTPSVNLSVVKASNEDELIEVTIEACGVVGYSPQTVKLTREQARELDLLFESIDSKLNNVTSREESVCIYHDAIIELNRYGLLSQGISIEQAQRLVTGWYQNPYEKLLNNRQKELFPQFANVFCLLFGSATEEPNPQGGPPFMIDIGLLWMIFVPIGMLLWMQGEENSANLILYLISVNPIRFMNLIFLVTPYIDLHSFGLKGIVDIDDDSLLLGYTGFLLRLSRDKAYFFGSALAVKMAVIVE